MFAAADMLRGSFLRFRHIERVAASRLSPQPERDQAHNPLQHPLVTVAFLWSITALRQSSLVSKNIWDTPVRGRPRPSWYATRTMRKRVLHATATATLLCSPINAFAATAVSDDDVSIMECRDGWRAGTVMNATRYEITLRDIGDDCGVDKVIGPAEHSEDNLDDTDAYVVYVPAGEKWQDHTGILRTGSDSSKVGFTHVHCRNGTWFDGPFRVSAYCYTTGW